jgi:hypothetical protein
MVALSCIETAAWIDEYIDERGMVVQCCHCRRVRRPGASMVWVELAIEPVPYPRTSHGVCEACMRIHYPDALEDYASR